MASIAAHGEHPFVSDELLGALETAELKRVGGKGKSRRIQIFNKVTEFVCPDNPLPPSYSQGAMELQKSMLDKDYRTRATASQILASPVMKDWLERRQQVC